ncbi:MAG TPA: hypothetical protein VJZ76_06720 [Thermoanaerobaculia bacterium]|nr:hypothetical protein [Thermoanaerobaculia bacterium]
MPKYTLFTIMVCAEAIGVIAMRLWERLDRHEGVALVVVSLAMAHWGHLIQERYRARTPKDVSKTISAIKREQPDPYGGFDVLGWLDLIKGFRKRGLSPEFVSGLIAEFEGLNVPRQVEFILKASFADQVKKMHNLTNGQPVEGDLETQYLYAGGVARYYRERSGVPTIYATALDIPSVFYEKYNPYFKMQEDFSLNDELFEAYRHAEDTNMKRILAGGNGIYARQDPPAKARIVVIKQETLLAELERDGFWKFLEWHVGHRFGVKFFIRDLDREQMSYEQQLRNRTQKEPIYDFIVYGTECVFGRTNPEPEGRNWFGFRHAPKGTVAEALVTDYRDFFKYLWSDHDERHADDKTYTLTELWTLDAFKEKVHEQSKQRREQLLRLY